MSIRIDCSLGECRNPITPDPNVTPTNTEFVECSLCGSSRSSLLFPDSTLSPQNTHGVVRCASCGFVYRNIRMTEEAMRSFYERKDYQEPSADWVAGRVRVFSPYLKQLGRFRKKGRILDVGAGHGFFLGACKDQGWDCHGIELSPECRHYANSRFGIDLSAKPLEKADFDKDCFDVVTFWNVLDQLRYPIRALDEAFRVLRPGGAVLIRSPNATFHVTTKSLSAALSRILGRKAMSDQPVFHLYSFNRPTLRIALNNARFERVKVEPAILSWTTAHDARTSFGKTLTAGAVSLSSKLVYQASLHQLLISPSYIGLALKPQRVSAAGN